MAPEFMLGDHNILSSACHAVATGSVASLERPATGFRPAIMRGTFHAASIDRKMGSY